MLPKNVSGSIALFIYWDSYDQFKEKLYPIAKKIYFQSGVKAVIVTSYWNNIPYELLQEDWLLVHKLEEFNAQKTSYNSSLKKIGNRVVANFKENYFWKKQARSIMKMYKPIAVYMWKPYIKEIPWIIKIANKNKILTFFIGEYNVVFNQKSIKKLFHKNIIISAKKDAQNSKRTPFWLSFFIIYLANGILSPIIEFVSYLLLGVGDWRRNLFTIPSVSYHCVSNHLFGKELLKIGASAKKIVVTGVPEQDALFELNEKKKTWDINFEKQKLGIGKKDKSVVFLLENFPALQSELNASHVNILIGNVAQEVLKLPNVELVIKIHPRDNIQDYSWISEKFPEVYILKEVSTIALVSLADVVLTHGSTSISMSLPMNCPALIVDFYNYWLCDVIHKGYGVNKVNSPLELYNELKCIIDDSERKNNPRLELAKSIIDGNAVNRILALSDIDRVKDL